MISRKLLQLFALFGALLFVRAEARLLEDKPLTTETKYLAKRYATNGHAVWLPMNGQKYRYFFVGDGGELKVFSNGTATLKGTVENSGDPTMKWEINLFFHQKKSYQEVVNSGGKFKGTKHGDQSKWDFYRIDGSKSTFKGKGKFAGKTLKIDDKMAEYWVQFGKGANDKNGQFGLSTWFRTSGDMNLHGDVNVILHSELEDPGKIKGVEKVCGPYDPDPIFSEKDAYGGYGGQLEYKWQIKKVKNGQWENIPNSNSSSYDPEPITQSAWYRRLAKRTMYGNWKYSNVVDKHVIAAPEVEFTKTDVSCASTGSVTFTFKDRSDRTNIQFSVDGGNKYYSSVSDKSGSKTYLLEPGTYQLFTRWGNKECPVDLGKVVIKSLDEGKNKAPLTFAGKIKGDERLCAASTPSKIFCMAEPYGGNGGQIQMKWQVKTEVDGEWKDITGAYGEHYQPGRIEYTTWYRRLVRRSTCGEFIASNVVTKKILTPPQGVEVYTKDPSCQEAGSITFKFEGLRERSHIEFSLDGGLKYLPRIPDNSGSITYGELIAGTYNLMVRWGNNDCPVDLGEYILENAGSDLLTDAGSIEGDARLCGEMQGMKITGTEAQPSANIVYKWQKRIDKDGAWEDVNGANGKDYQPGVLTQSTWFRRLAKSNTCGEFVASNEVYQRVLLLPQASHYVVQPSCEKSGSITFTFAGVKERTYIEFSLNGGAKYERRVSDEAGSVTYDYLLPGTYHLKVRWGNNECALDMGVETLHPVTGPNGSSPLTFAGQIKGGEKKCGAYDPGPINNKKDASGGQGGSIVYQWQVKTDKKGTWENIQGATSKSYNPPMLEKSAWYRRLAKRTSCGGYIASNIIDKHVLAPPSAKVSLKEPGCAEANGAIAFIFKGQPGRSHIEFSLDGGKTYQPSVRDNSCLAVYDNLAAGIYDLQVRWGNNDCPVDLGSYELGKEAPISYSRPPSPNDREVFLPLPDFWRDYVFEDGGAAFHENEDGTATLTGKIVNKKDPLARWKVFVHLIDKMTYQQWTSKGGSPKVDPGTNFPVEDWAYYTIDPAKSYMKGLDKLDGKLIYIKDSDPRYAFQVGVGANDRNEDFGASGWFETSGSYQDFKGDFNISLEPKCEKVPSSVVCYTKPWKEGEREVFFPVPDYWRDLNFLGEGARIEEFEDGTATLIGTMANTEDPLVLWEVYVKLEDRLTYEEWTDMGGFAKESRGELGDETTWSFYKINGEESFFRGIGKAEGKLVYIKDSDPLYRFQVGNGANNYNSDYGASGWFTTTGTYEDFKGDFNVSIECKVVPGKKPKVLTECVAMPFSENGHSVWIPMDGMNAKYRWADFGEFKTYNDGTATLTGTAVNVGDPNAIWEVELQFHMKQDYEAWLASDGSFKGTKHGDETMWTYYQIDEAHSRFIGQGKFEGVVLTINDRSPKYAVQLGDGANDKNSQFGLSTWFTAVGGTYDLYGDVNIILNCIDVQEPEEESVCYSKSWKDGEREVFLPLPDYWRDCKFIGEGARFREFNDGTATLSGTMVNMKDETVKWTVYVLLEDKKTYDEWTAMGGLAKESRGEFGDETKWSFYRINSRYSVFKGAGTSNKHQKMYLRDSDPLYRFQVGDGANNYNSDYGASGWFMTSGSYEGFKGDFNISFECKDMAKVDFLKKELAEGITVYPNPTKDVFTVEATDIEDTERYYELRLVDITGKQVFSASWKLNQPRQIDVSDLPTGIYNLMIIDVMTNTAEIQRVMKQ